MAMIEKEITLSEGVEKILNDALMLAQKLSHEYVTPEHVLLTIARDYRFLKSFDMAKIGFSAGIAQLCIKMMKEEMMPEGMFRHPEPSAQLEEMLRLAYLAMVADKKEQMERVHLLEGMRSLQDSCAAYTLNTAILPHQWPDFIKAVNYCFDPANGIPEHSPYLEEDELDDYFDDDDDFFDDDYDENEEGNMMPHDWHQLVTCISDKTERHNPLIGREKELDRTIQVLCRAEKNNPLHVGEPGVGKTSLVYGLAKMINEGRVPQRLKGARIYSMDMGQMLAGAQYRGDFEKRLKMVMDGAATEGNSIIYLDEIHNIMGAGRGSDGGPDAANILKPYMEGGELRFIGSTTYEEFNRHIAKNKGIVRRFQQIDILEPSEEETVNIIKGLIPLYQNYHHVTYRQD